MARRVLELASPMADLPASPTHYQRLGVAPDATMDQIRTAHQTWLARQASPGDRGDANADAAGPLAGASPSAQGDLDPAPASPASPVRPEAPEPSAGTVDAAAVAAAAAAMDAAEMRLALAVLSDPLRRRVYDAFLLSQAQLDRRAGQWWLKRSFWRGAGAAAAVSLMVGMIGAVGFLVWRLY